MEPSWVSPSPSLQILCNLFYQFFLLKLFQRLRKDHVPKILHSFLYRAFLYQYDPKWKDILPWYDIWPLVFPFDYAKGGFYGINVHYLPPNARADLMVSLLSAHGEGAMLNKRFKMKLSYNIITQFKPARACIKRYLYNHVQGKGFYTIPADDWTYAAALPMQKFKKASNSEVWRHSKTLY